MVHHVNHLDQSPSPDWLSNTEEEERETVILDEVPPQARKKDVESGGNVFVDMIQELEALTPQSLTLETTTKDKDGIIENVESDTSKAKIARNVENEGIVVYPSRFSPLLGIDEENEVEVEELGKELEDGEIIASKVEGKKTQ
ncbi:hypothetical protein YC2023_018284 [Brassica napus]